MVIAATPASPLAITSLLLTTIWRFGTAQASSLGRSLIYGLTMTVPRRAQMTLGALSLVLLGGMLGLAWWFWRHRQECQPVARFRRVRAVLVAAGLVIIAVGAVSRLVFAFQPVPGCSSQGRAAGVTRVSPSEMSLLAQKAATWPETGIGLLYSRVGDAHVCWSSTANYYVAVHANNIAGARAMALGDIVLTPRFNMPREQLRTLAGHEARHRTQWAVWTVIGGPLAFPVVYAIDDFFFPGPRNHFERQAGLEAGGYPHSGTGPVLGPVQLATLGVLAAIIVVALLRARRRRASTRSAADPAAAGMDRVTNRLTHEE
jgi:hypothetical protein